VEEIGNISVIVVEGSATIQSFQAAETHENRPGIHTSTTPLDIEKKKFEPKKEKKKRERKHEQ